MAWADAMVGVSSKMDRHRKLFMVATSLVEMDRSAGFTGSDSTNPLRSCPSSSIYAKTISRSNRNFWKKFIPGALKP